MRKVAPMEVGVDLKNPSVNIDFLMRMRLNVLFGGVWPLYLPLK